MRAFLVGGLFPVVRPLIFAPELEQTSSSWPSAADNVHTAEEQILTRQANTRTPAHE